MNSFFVFISIFLAIIFIGYFGAKAIKYIAYSLSNSIARGIYDARNGIANEEKTIKPVIIKSQNQTEVTLSAFEKMIRSDWRKSLFIYFLGSLIITIFCSLFIEYSGNSSVAREVLEDGMITLAASGVYLSLMYYFAYVKFGTKWIGWFVIISPIRTTLDTFNEIIEIFKTPDMNSTGFTYFIIVTSIYLALYIYFWINCKKLYELNTVLKRRKIEKNVSEQEAVETA